MKNPWPVLILVILTIFLNCKPNNKKSNDGYLVIRNAKIVTMDPENPEVEAIAVKNNTIVALGSNDDMKPFLKKASRVIELNNGLVLPGFNDAHAHFGPINPDYIELRYTTNPSLITQKVKKAVAKAEPGTLIQGGHWEHEMFETKAWPTKELIDAVSPNNPVILSRADGHSVLVNSYVLKEAGITKHTPNPFGGEIQKDPVTGEPTGILKETAWNLINDLEEKYSSQNTKATNDIDRGWMAAFNMAAQLGVTSLQMPGDGFDEASIYQAYLEQEKLTLRIDLSAPLTTNPDTLRWYQKLKSEFPITNNWIRFGYLKDYMDGTLGSATMMVFEPFNDAPHTTGLAQMTYPELVEKIRIADSMNFQIGIHAIGPKANRWVLNAYEEVQAETGVKDSRHRIEHAQILSLNDIPRFSELGVIASMQPTHCITDKRFCEKRIGYERSKGAYAWNSLIEAKANLAFGTDYSVEPLNPMEGLYAAVTRKDRFGEAEDGWIPEQKITMYQAIYQYTVGSAYAQFMEDRKGTLKVGYLADMVILNQDLFSIKAEEIMKTKVLYTIVDGKIVYSAVK